MNRGRRCWWWVASIVWWASSVSSASPGDELWRKGLADEPCRIALVNELGGVRVETLSGGDPSRVLGPSQALALAATLEDGQIVLTAKQLDGAADGGDLVLQVPPRCEVSVRTDAGTVRVDLEPGTHALSVDTVTGDITAEVEPGGDFTIDLATSGEITVDFTVTIDYRYHSEPAKHGRVRIGTGKTNVRLMSRRGCVSVLRRSVERNP